MAGKPIVAFLGPQASYTHQAARQAFPGDEYDIQAQGSIDDVFAAVQSGSASVGVVPFENSSNGSVIFTLDLFADRDGRHPDILVTGEVYVAVKHCLIGHVPQKASGTERPPPPSHDKFRQPWRRSLVGGTAAPAVSSPHVDGSVTPAPQAPRPGGPAQTTPLHDLGHIQKLYSHPQAWGQCQLFLNTYLRGIERHDVSSTSRAAEIVAADSSGTSAAISSAAAATLNHLSPLATGIEDHPGNTTRFFLIRHRSAAPTLAQRTDTPIHKSLVSFTVEHHRHGSLADALAVFKSHDLNLTSCNSRPSADRPWKYIFFVEFHARRTPPHPAAAVDRALQDLQACTGRLRWLGTWPNELSEE